MDVNPEALRQFATRVDEVGAQCSVSPMPHHFDALAALMPGSTTAYAAQTAASAMRPLLAGVGHYFGQVSAAVYTAAGDYETSDAVLADRFGRVPAPGRA